MSNVLIPKDLFSQLLIYHIYDDDYWIEEIIEGLKKKEEAVINADIYRKYKTAETEEEREKARLEYLDRKGIHKDFRW